jgi:phospholipid/cholesterol/gamma-HCH transport system substrate-binding protein
MDRSPLRDFIAGLFVLAGIAAIAYLSLRVSDFKWRSRDGMKLFASFDETGDLHIRAPVVIAGVRVGEVRSISLEKNYRARVDMELDATLKLPVDTSASIVTAGVLGDRYIEIQPGGDEQMLKSGDRISFTESALVLERLIGHLLYASPSGQNKEYKVPPTTAATQR